MKAKQGFKLRNVCGEYIIVAEGKENIDFSSLISMNESSAYLWNAIADREFTAEDLATLLTKEYDVEYEQALNDANIIASQWLEAGICD